MKHPELNGCALTDDCRLLISGRNQHRPRRLIITQRTCFRNGVKKIYDFEILISEIERRPALYEFCWKKYSDKGLKEGHWGEICKGETWKCWALWGKPKILCFVHSMCRVLPQRRLYHRHLIIICNNKTHQQCQIFQIKELNFPNCVRCITKSFSQSFCGSWLWFLLQTQGVFYELRTECHVELLVFRVLLSLAPHQLS